MASFGTRFPYVVILKNTTDRAFTLLAVLLNFASAVFFFNEFILNGRPMSIGNAARAAGLAVLLVLMGWTYIRARRGMKPIFARAYILSALLWVSMPYMQWLVFPFMVLAILEHQVKFQLEVGFSE